MLFTFMLVLAGCSGAEARERPFLAGPPFAEITSADPEALRQASRGDFDRGAGALAQLYRGGGRLNAENADFYRILHNAIRVHEGTGDAQAREIAAAMLTAATAEFHGMPEDELRAQLDEEGAFNRRNVDMKEHCYDLALLYHVTGDLQAARQAAIILDRYNEVIRQWPLRERGGDGRFSQDDARFKWRWDATGLYGQWIYGFVERGQRLVFAYDLIYASGVMQEMGVRESAEAAIRYHTEFFETFHPIHGNLDDYDLRGYARYGLLLPEPEYVHHVVQRMGEVIQYGFYADGFWHEGSPSYHKDLVVGFSYTLSRMLKGYSDPPGFISEITGTRFDDLDLTARFYPQFKRMWDVLGAVTLPNRRPAAIHDASLAQVAWWMPHPITHSSPKLIGCMGHVIMAKGQGEHQHQAHLHFSGMHGHEHYDTLNILVWTQGREILSETRYRPIPGDVSTWQWHSMTAGHNTVVIDEANQLHRLSSHRRTLTEDDALPFPDPRYRNYGHGDSLTDGRLRYFAAGWAPVQISEAEGEESYHPVADLYRRTLGMVEIDERHIYLVDVFRVRGGNLHDWMLRGGLDLPYRFETDLPMEDVPGTAHTYIDQLRAADLDGVSTFSFIYEDGARSRHWLLMPPGSALYAGRGPAMRREGHNPFTFVRHQGGESLFVAVHEFWAGDTGPQIASVEPVEIITGDPLDAAVSIRLADGRHDLFISRFDGDDPARSVVAAGEAPLSMQGTAAHVRRAQDGAVARVFGVGLADLQVGDVHLAGHLPAHEGVITSTERRLKGDEAEALHTDVALPTDGTLDGAPIILHYGDELVQSFPIERVEALPGGGSRILLQYDAGVTIEEDGALVKLHYYPGWGIRGECRFRIVNTLLGARGEDGTFTAHQHPRTDWPPPLENRITYWLPD